MRDGTCDAANGKLLHDAIVSLRKNGLTVHRVAVNRNSIGSPLAIRLTPISDWDVMRLAGNSKSQLRLIVQSWLLGGFAKSLLDRVHEARLRARAARSARWRWRRRVTTSGGRRSSRRLERGGDQGGAERPTGERDPMIEEASP